MKAALEIRFPKAPFPVGMEMAEICNARFKVNKPTVGMVLRRIE
jgi:hypothetical protein